MQHNDNSRATRKRRLPQKYYNMARSLDWHADVTTDAERAEVEAAINRLVKKTKFKPDPDTYQDPLVESMRLFTTWDEQGRPDLSNVDKDKDVRRLAKLAVDIETRVEEARRRARAQEADEPQWRRTAAKPDAKKPGRLYTLTVEDGQLHNLGLVAGDRAEVYEADDLKPGDAAAVTTRGSEYALCGRVVAADADSITIRHEYAAETVTRAEIITLGRIDVLNPTRVDPLTSEQRGRVEVLQEKLEELGGEDDQILRCTARYKYEKEIYDIEHPAADADDWGAWETDE